MWVFIIWWIGIGCEAVLLIRALATRTLAKYPYFFSYILCIFLVDLTRFFVYTRHPSDFRNVYWSTQFLTIAMAYGVMLEVLRHVLMRYQGAARLGDRLLWLSFFSVVTYITYRSVSVKNWSEGQTGFKLERDLRTVQAFVILGILLIVSYYGIELGKNLKGMLLGYGAYLGILIMELAAQTYMGPSYDATWRSIGSYLMFIPTTIWLATLWWYHPAPDAATSTAQESDYESLARRTKSMIGSILDSFRGT